MIEIINAKKTYNNKSEKVVAFENVNLDFYDCGLVTIFGESGSGKTSFLNCLAGLDSLTTGEIRGISKDDIAFIPQDYQLIEDLTVFDNLSLTIKISKEEALNILKKVNLEDVLLNKKIYDLSGGQKQRVAIARALLLDKKIILADEPTGSLDEENSKIIADLFKELSSNKLVIIVSHNTKLFESCADEIINIEYGKIVSLKGITFKKEITNKEIINLFSYKKIMLITLKRIKKYPFRFLINCLLLILVFVGFILSLALLTNNKYLSYQKAYEDHGITNVDFIYKDEENTPIYKDIEEINEETSFIKNKNFLIYCHLDLKFNDSFYSVKKIYINEEIPYRNIEISSKLIPYDDINDILNRNVMVNESNCIIKNIDIVNANIDDDYYSYIKCSYKTLDYFLTNNYINIGEYRSNIYNDASNKSYSMKIYLDKSNLNDNEVIIPKYFFNEFDNPESYYIGKKVRIYFGYEKSFYIECLVKDIGDKFYVSNELFSQFIFYSMIYDKNDYKIGISVPNPTHNTIKSLEKIGCFNNSYITEKLNYTQDFIDLLIPFIIAISIILIIIIILFDLSMINNSFIIKRNEIGILRLLNIPIIKTVKLLIVDNIYSIVISYLISLCIIPYVIYKINNILFVNNHSISIHTINFNYLYSFFIILISLFLLLIYCIICIVKIKRKSDIELIYNK